MSKKTDSRLIKNISKYKTMAGASYQLFLGLKKLGHNPVWLKPAESERAGYGKCYTVLCEEIFEGMLMLSLGEGLYVSEASLPYDHDPEFNVTESSEWYCECYYSYTLCFYKH